MANFVSSQWPLCPVERSADDHAWHSCPRRRHRRGPREIPGLRPPQCPKVARGCCAWAAIAGGKIPGVILFPVFFNTIRSDSPRREAFLSDSREAFWKRGDKREAFRSDSRKAFRCIASESISTSSTRYKNIGKASRLSQGRKKPPFCTVTGSSRDYYVTCSLHVERNCGCADHPVIILLLYSKVYTLVCS